MMIPIKPLVIKVYDHSLGLWKKIIRQVLAYYLGFTWLPASWRVRFIAAVAKMLHWPRRDQISTAQKTLAVSVSILHGKNSQDLTTLLCGKKPAKGEAYRFFCGEVLGHTWAEMLSVEVLLNAANCQRIIELGTANGHFACYLSLWAVLNGLEFYTVEKNPLWIDPRVAHLLDLHGHQLIIGDCFSNAVISNITSLIRKTGRTLLICDNGNKRREFEMYTPSLKQGDLTLVDDWNDEIKYEDIEKVARDNGLVFFHPEFFSRFHTHHICFVKL